MGYGPPPEPKPGIIPLRPIGLGEILDGAVTYIRQNPKATLGLSAIIAGASQIILVLSGGWLGLRFARAGAMSPQALDSAREIVGTFGASSAALLVTIVVTILASLLLTGMLTAIVGRAVLGQRATIGTAWQQAAPRLPALLGIAVLISLVLILAMIVLVTPGVLIAVFGSLGWGIALAVLGFLAWFVVLAWVFTTFALATPTAVLERASAVTALRRSRALLRGSGNWWRAFGILLLAWIIAGLIGGLLQLPFSGGQFALQATGSFVMGQILATIGAILAATVVSPFSSGVPALLYVDMRMRREGLDMELQRAAGVTGPPPAGPAAPPGPVPSGPQGPGQGGHPPYGPAQGGPYGQGQPGPYGGQAPPPGAYPQPYGQSPTYGPGAQGPTPPPKW